MQGDVFRPGLSRDPQLVSQLREFQTNPRSLVFVSLAESYRKLGLFEQALEICAEGLEEHPDLPAGLLVKARIFFDQKRFAASLEIANAVLRRNPENIKARRLNAEIYLRLGQKQRALQSLTELLRLNPSDGEALRAMEDLESELNPALPVVDTRLIMRGSSDSRAAIQEFQVEHLSDWRESGAIESPELPQTVAAEKPAVSASEDDSEPAFATRTIAELYLRQGHEEKARKVLRRMLEQDANDAWTQAAWARLNGEENLSDTTSENPAKRVALAKVKYLERLLARVQGVS